MKESSALGIFAAISLVWDSFIMSSVPAMTSLSKQQNVVILSVSEESPRSFTFVQDDEGVCGFIFPHKFRWVSIISQSRFIDISISLEVSCSVAIRIS